jgi:hypothetical protein
VHCRLRFSRSYFIQAIHHPALQRTMTSAANKTSTHLHAHVGAWTSDDLRRGDTVLSAQRRDSVELTPHRDIHDIATQDIASLLRKHLEPTKARLCEVTPVLRWLDQSLTAEPWQPGRVEHDGTTALASVSTRRADRDWSTMATAAESVGRKTSE